MVFQYFILILNDIFYDLQKKSDLTNDTLLTKVNKFNQDIIKEQ